MITVSQLGAFTEAPWHAGAQWATERAKDATEAQHELETQAASLRRSWPDVVGGLAAGVVSALAASHQELATDYTDGASIIEDAAGVTSGLRDSLHQWQATIAADPRVSGPDDQGVVDSSVPFSLAHLIEVLQGITYAKQLTVSVREVLVQATDQDREATIALFALLGIELPPSGDGPIDLTDAGILLEADLNKQDAYGDCTTLSTLISLAHSDPGFIRDHIHWNPDTGRYEVTIYRDGKPVVVSVDPATLPSAGSQQAVTNRPSFLSLYEQALQQEYGDVKDGKFEDVPIARITGVSTPLGDPPSVADIRAGMSHHPPSIMTADTANADPQPGDVDPTKRVVPGHTYAVRGVDSQGNVVLQNPWGPQGGWHDGKYYPGEVHLTPSEYQHWFSNGAKADLP